jgi:hypothetical protein
VKNYTIISPIFFFVVIFFVCRVWKFPRKVVGTNEKKNSDRENGGMEKEKKMNISGYVCLESQKKEHQEMSLNLVCFVLNH